MNDVAGKYAERSNHNRNHANYQVGQRLVHAVFGQGKITVIEGNPANPVLEVAFNEAGTRRLVASLAPISLQ